MPLWRDEPPPSPATLLTLAVVGLVSVASLSQVFHGAGYVAWALPALALGAAVTFLTARRSLGVAFVATTAAWALTMPALFARASTAALVPTPDAVRALRELIRSGLVGAAQVTAPVEAEPRFMALVWTAFLFLGFLGASWIVVRRPVGVVVCALGVVAFAGGVGSGQGRSAVGVAAVAAAVAFFLAEGRHRIELWGRTRVPAWFGVPTLAAVSVLAASAPFLFGQGALVNLRAVVRPRLVIIKPLSDVKRQLDVQPPIEVLRVTADRPTYWRLTGLDDYDGTEWVLRARPRQVVRGAVPPPEFPPAGEAVTQHFRLTSLLAPWLPAAYAAAQIDTTAEVEVDAGSQTLLLRGDTTPGLIYTVTSRLPAVTQNVPMPQGDPTDPRSAVFGELARSVVTDAASPLVAAQRLEGYFKGFTYDEAVPGGHDTGRLERFLAERKGYCEQFAATMTLMLRSLGYDARVGVGFLPGLQRGGEFVVSTRDAHAWVEVNLPGAGWTSFDPTPDRGLPNTVPPQVREQEVPVPPPPPLNEALPEPTPFREIDAAELPDRGVSIPYRRIAPFVLAALALAAPGTAKRLRRSHRRSGDPGAVVLGAFAELSDRAADLGIRRRQTETQREFGRRLVADATDDDDAACSQLVAVTDRSLFGPAAASADDARRAWEALTRVLRSVRSRAPRWRRVLAAFDPRTLVPPNLLARLRPARLRLRPRPAAV